MIYLYASVSVSLFVGANYEILFFCTQVSVSVPMTDNCRSLVDFTWLINSLVEACHLHLWSVTYTLALTEIMTSFLKKFQVPGQSSLFFYVFLFFIGCLFFFLLILVCSLKAQLVQELIPGWPNPRCKQIKSTFEAFKI